MTIDLSTYVRVGRYDLPEPTRSAHPANNLLAQEASAVTFNHDTGTLFIVGDGGTAIVEVSLTGQLIGTMTLAQGSSPQGTEFYDPEGLAYIGNGQFVMTEERDRNAVKFTYQAGTTLTRANAQTVDLGTFSPNIGLEGVTYDPLTGGFIFGKEKSPQGVFQTTIDFANGTASNGSPTTENAVNLFDPALLGLVDIADVYALSNVASLAGTPDANNLLVLSQESGKIVLTDRAGNVLSTLTLQSDPGNPLDIVNQQHEGVTMGPDGTLYVVSENGGGDADHPQLWVYKPSNGINAAPTAITLANARTAVLENTSTATRLKVADVQVTDDGLGSNTLSVSGADAAAFEVDATGLYIKAGTVLDYETKTSYNVTVSVDDTTLGATPDASTAFTLDVTDVAIEGTLPTVYVSEVAPWSSGNSPVAADWFEVTNGGTTALDITGWKFDDNSNNFAASVALNGITTIAPGESVIFIETNSAATVAAFRSTWFGINAPGLQIGTYSGSGVGLSTGGDAVNLYNAAGVLQANVVFGASPTGPFSTFDNAAGINNATISTLSVNGVRGAFKAVNDAAETGSPGAVAEIPPVITSNGGGSTALIQISENTTAVTTVTATDANFGDVPTFSITGGADAAKFAIDPTGILRFVAAPDFEAPTDAGQNNFYDVVVTASDGTLTDSQAIQVKVNNVSDTAPVITSNGAADTAAITVAENLAAVTTVVASDDVGDTLTYSITGGADAAKFTINPTTGALSFLQAPNFELPTDAGADNRYDVTVAASDGTFSDTQAITVTVSDVADTGSSQTPYLLSSQPNVSIRAIITTGDATSKADGGTYLFGGIPDGLGAFDNGDGTITVLVNHEISSSLGAVRAHGAKGTYVSQLVVRKADLAVISGKDAFSTVKLWNGSSFITATQALSRFCSADLPAVSAYFNAASGLGTTDRIFMTGEENGAEGKQLGVVVTGSEAGTAYELPWLGKFSHENAAANPFAQDKTIVLGTDDAGGGKGQVYVYVGTKQATGLAVDKAGLTNGVLYGFKVSGLAQEDATTNLQGAAFTLAPLGDVSAITGAALETASNAAGVTQFLRPEDIAWDPTNPARGYFVVTDNINSNGSPSTPVQFHSRLYQFTFADITQPELGGTITAVLDGTEGQAMFDNLTVGADGRVTLQEDVGNNPRLGKVWQYDPATDKLTEIAAHDPARFLAGGADFRTQDEEASGVIDVTDLLGDATHKVYLLDTQNHAAASGPNATTLVEGGQLQLLTITNNAPVITSNGGGASATVYVKENSTTVATVAGTDDAVDTVRYSITGGADAARFTINATTGALSFVAAPDFEAPTDAGANNVYDVVVTASDGSLTDSQALAVNVTSIPDTTPYLVPVAGNVTVTSILTTGDQAGNSFKANGTPYVMAGIPDGLGLFDNGDGTVTVLMNHEIGFSNGAPLGTVRAHGAAGAFVSQLVIDKATLAVLSGKDAITTVKLFDDATGTFVTASNYAINRLCSADLADPSAYYWVDPATSVAYGTQSRIFMTGEESGSEGKEFAVFVTGPEAGTAYEFADCGLFSWENNAASPFAQKKTITIGQDDGQNGQVYVYIGEKQATGSEFQKAGLEDGHLFGIKVTNLVNAIAANSNETDAKAASGRFTLHDEGVVGALTGAQLDAQSEAAGVTSFQRPEDGSWDPTNPNVYWFVTTASITGQSRLYKMTFDDITQPELGGTIEAVLDSNQLPVNDSVGPRMMDNITVTTEGKIIIQEDVGNNAFIGRVLQYDPVTDKLTVLARHDPSRFLAGGANFLTQDEESSGVIDVTSSFGDATHKAYLLDTQSHKFVGGELVEGGQLQLIRVALNAPVITSNGAGDSAAVSVAENTTTVTTVTATDDLVDTVTYSITGGADAAKFTIDAATGVLSFVKAPNFEAPTDFGGDNSYDVVVTASDGSLTDSQAIAVTVTDVLDTGSFTGTARADTFTAPNGFDYTIRGLAGADILTGNTGNDVIDGGLGNDLISGAGGDDILEGGVGNDSIDGGTGGDFLSGSAGNDLLDGGNDDDALFGGGGIDTLIGGQGNDVLTGGAQRDNLTGGAGLDRFVLDDIQLLDDTITDFTIGEDRIVLDTSAFAAFQGSEGVAASQFTLGTKATTAEQRLVYDQSLGRLYYDADGNGAGAKKLVATLGNRAAISASDFAVQGAAVPSLAATQFVQAISQFGVVSSGVLGADNDPFAQTPVQPLFAASVAA